MRSIGNHSLQIGLVNCLVQMATAIDEHDRKGSMYHHHDDGSYAPVKMPKICEGCSEKVSVPDTGYDYDGQIVIITKDEKATLQKNAGPVIELESFVSAKEVNSMLFSGEKCYWLLPDVDKKRGSKQNTATYKSLARVLAEEDRVGVVTYTKWNKTRRALLRVEPTESGDLVLVLQNLLWVDELRDAEMPEAAKEVDPDPRLLPVMRSVVESMTEAWNPDEYVDLYEQALTAAIEAKAAGKPVEVVEAKPIEKVDDMDALLAALQATADAKKPANAAPAKKAPAKKAPAKKAGAA